MAEAAASLGYQLPHLTIEWRKNSDPLFIRIASGVFPAGNGVVIGADGIEPMPELFDLDDVQVAVVGSPIVAERIDRLGAAKLAASGIREPRYLRLLNGQFLILIVDREAPNTLYVINDRFTSIPLYWDDSSRRFLGAFLYADLFRRLRAEGNATTQPAKLFEFLWLQRLLGDRTLDGSSLFLLPASVLRVDASGSRFSSYWRPDFTKTHRSDDVASNELAELFRSSMRRRTTDGKRYGLFLSGGFDSRMVLAASTTPMACFTVGHSDNLEVECARAVADVRGDTHAFLQLPEEHLVRTADAGAFLSGGMYALDHAHFLGLRDFVRTHADVVFHGHAIDYLFQGMYMHARYRRFLGRETFLRTAVSFPDDLVSAFLHNASYRLKYVNLLELVEPEWRAELWRHLTESVQRTMALGSDVCDTPEDYWEYFIIHALARHYSHPNIVSKMHCAEQRTPAFDNELFEFYLSMPSHQRITAGVLRGALRKLNPAMASLRMGNHGMPAAASPAYKTFYMVTRKLMRHLTGNKMLRTPGVEDRTWPDRDRYLCEQRAFQTMVRSAIESERLVEALPFFNWDLLRQKADGWMARPSGGAGLLMSLLTIHRFLLLTR